MEENRKSRKVWEVSFTDRGTWSVQDRLEWREGCAPRGEMPAVQGCLGKLGRVRKPHSMTVESPAGEPALRMSKRFACLASQTHIKSFPHDSGFGPQ